MTVTKTLLDAARRVVDQEAAGRGVRWNGVSRSYFDARPWCIDSETVAALFLALEAEGYGVMERDRFYPTSWLARLTPAQRATWERERAKAREWDRRVAEWDKANVPDWFDPVFWSFERNEMAATRHDIQAYLALRQKRLDEVRGWMGR
jgi:hypothetical protein